MRLRECFLFLFLSFSATCFFADSLHAGDVLYLKAKKFVTSTAQFAQELKTLSEGSPRSEYYIVQLKKPQFYDLKEKLALSGVQFISYVPDDAYIIKANPVVIQRLQSNPLVQAIMPYLPQFKLSPSVGSISVFNQNYIQRVAIRCFSNEGCHKLLDLLKPEMESKSSQSMLVATLTNKEILEFANQSEVEWIEPVKEIHSMVMDFAETEEVRSFQASGDYSSLTGFETGTKIMNFESFWNQGYFGSDEIIAMADSGLDSGDVQTVVDDVSGNIIEGQIFGLFADSWSDPTGHGTHVAGSIAGKGKRSLGQLIGAARESSLVVQSMWSPMLNTLTTPPNLKKLFEPAYQAGARIHSDSWGSGSGLGEYDFHAHQVDEFIWEHPDFLIVFAAGNSGADLDQDGRIDHGTISSPGTAKNVLTVGSSENLLFNGGKQQPWGELRQGVNRWNTEPIASDKVSDNIDGLAAFSSRGPTKDGRIKPDVVAPGTNILSLCSQVTGASVLWGAFNDYYCFSGGTSMSTPLVSGAASLVRQRLKKEYHFVSPSAALVKALLIHSAYDMYPGQYGFGSSVQELEKEGPNFDQGFGRVDLKETLNPDKTYFVIEDNQSISEGVEFSKKFESRENGSIKVTLYYTDAPATAAAEKALVNDLDLSVYVDDKLIKVSEDKLNNIEQASVEVQKNQTVEVKVKPFRLPQLKNGHLPFVLIITKL
ncbi:MAG: S8 family serine peptidase [Bdellovibrionales bacterium]|nr:S8 family serine peptidase [Bdellovibrionales bacterium]